MKTAGTSAIVSAVAASIFIATPLGAEQLAAEVYRDDDIRIHAGISGQHGRIIHFGDVLPLVVEILYNADRVSISEPDDDFFHVAWSGADTPVLLARKTMRSPGRLQTVFYFQILDCPGDDWTCPGTREYLIPEFGLDYRVSGSAASLRFRPWPSILTVSSAIPLDEEDQLFPFQKYFPTNAYPDPVSGSDRRREAYGVAGIGMAVLLGGILMWPFRLRKTGPLGGKSQARWRELLQELENDGVEDERHFFDRLRRAFVWYCTDELKTDPFDWLHSGEEASGGSVDESLAELKSLFIELLHCPSGTGPELCSRFSDLVERGEQH